MSLLLGCIADDFTGGTDLAGMLVKYGMRTVQMIGTPKMPVPEDVDAVVIGLKTRSTPVKEAVAESLEAFHWLRQAGCAQFYFKYCSTFDSTPRGNIGPVIDALMDALGVDFTIACPAFPANHRTVYQGHLFVGGTLLSESGMRQHPLTPMTDSNIVRVLQAQTLRKVGLVPYSVVRSGSEAIRRHFAKLRESGIGIAIVDAILDDDLKNIGSAVRDLRLVTAGSGAALGLPENFREEGRLPVDPGAARLLSTEGLKAVLAGSCSVATRGQVKAMQEVHPSFYVDPLKVAKNEKVVEEALQWASPQMEKGPILIYATSDPNRVSLAQRELGKEAAGQMIEQTLSAIARGLVDRGVRQLIVAGGETSGAVVKELGVTGLRIGPEIDPGVPWTTTLSPDKNIPRLALALKSGNFGTEDFFLKAWQYL